MRPSLCLAEMEILQSGFGDNPEIPDNKKWLEMHEIHEMHEIELLWLSGTSGKL